MNETTTLYSLNSAALRQHQSELVDRLDSLEIPPTVRWVAGRDGALTAQLDPTEGACRWVGGTSMPSISAAATLTTFQDRGCNVVLPGIGSGQEALTLLGRMAKHTALFVYESNLLLLKLALHLRDYAVELDSFRLIPLVDESLESCLIACLSRHPGLECPRQLVCPIPLPNQTQDSLRTQLERVIQHIETYRTSEMARLSETPDHSDKSAKGNNERICLVTADPRPDTDRWVKESARALMDQGVDVVAFVPDSPLRCHGLARLKAVHEHRPDWILQFNGSAGRWQAHMPSDTPTAAWFLPDAPLETLPKTAWAESEHVYVSTLLQKEQLIRALPGIAGRITILEPGYWLESPIASASDNGSNKSISAGIAVIADLNDLRAESVGMTQGSHVELWAKVVELKTSRPGRTTTAEGLLQEAQRKTKIELLDAITRSHFQNVIAHQLIPTLAAIHAVQRLASCHGAIDLWGVHWPFELCGEDRKIDTLPPLDGRRRIYRMAKLVVFPRAGDPANYESIQALASGGFPIRAKTTIADPIAHPQLYPLLEILPSYSSLDELDELVKRALKDQTWREGIVEASVTMLRTSHTLLHRLQSIRATVMKSHEV